MPGDLFVLNRDIPFGPNFSLATSSKFSHLADDFIKMKSKTKVGKLVLFTTLKLVND